MTKLALSMVRNHVVAGDVSNAQSAWRGAKWWARQSIGRVYGN